MAISTGQESSSDSPAESLRRRMASGEAVFGLTARLARSAEIVGLVQGVGFDFLRIDMQHGLYDLETVGHIARTALAAGVCCAVRVRGVDDPDVGRLLDAGVTAIVFPDVENGADAERCVQSVRFPPRGRRSFGGTDPHFNYQPVPASMAAEALNQRALVICMIESATGLENVKQIASVEGMDVLYLGVNDYLIDVGRPSQWQDPSATEAVERIVAVSRDFEKFSGCGGLPIAEIKREAIAKGMLFLPIQSDLGILVSAAADWLGSIRS